VTEWSYYQASRGLELGSGGFLEGVLVVCACAAIEILVVAMVVGSVSLQTSLAISKAERRRGRCRRGRLVHRRLGALPELDAWLDSMWETEVEARRGDGERAAARLIGSQTPLVGIHCCHATSRECCIQLVFADGTTLALWSRSPASERILHRLRHGAVLEFASPADRGHVRFDSDDHAVLITGDLLLAGPPTRGR
jgi:hypothetical protein